MFLKYCDNENQQKPGFTLQQLIEGRKLKQLKHLQKSQNNYVISFSTRFPLVDFFSAIKCHMALNQRHLIAYLFGVWLLT